MKKVAEVKLNFRIDSSVRKAHGPREEDGKDIDQDRYKNLKRQCFQERHSLQIVRPKPTTMLASRQQRLPLRVSIFEVISHL